MKKLSEEKTEKLLKAVAVVLLIIAFAFIVVSFTEEPEVQHTELVIHIDQPLAATGNIVIHKPAKPPIKPVKTVKVASRTNISTPTETPTEAPTETPEPEFEKNVYEISDNEREILYRITEAEVTGEGSESYLEAKKNVASCVLVRLENGWANSIEGVVFQKKQFSPISDGRYWEVEITQQTRDAVDWVLKNGKTHNCEYFCTYTCSSYKSGFHSTLIEAFKDCEHAYFYDGEKIK